MRYGITVYSLVFTYTKYNLELEYYHSRDEAVYSLAHTYNCELKRGWNFDGKSGHEWRDETWCISIAISYRSWLTNHRVQFHYKERANPQITDYTLCYKCLQTAIMITKYAHPKVFIFVMIY